MANLISSPSVGTLVKKLLKLYPDLDTQDLIDLIRKSTHLRTDPNDGFGAREMIDEGEVMAKAKQRFAPPSNEPVRF